MPGSVGDGCGGRRDDAGDCSAPRHHSRLLTRERGGCVLVPGQEVRQRSPRNTDIDIHNIQRRRLLAPIQG